MAGNSYRKLVVWQKSMQLVEEIYKVTADFPKNEEFGLKSQMRRAAVSIPSNIAEGKGRNHKKEFLQFLSVATGSLYELETQLEVALRLKLVAQDAFGRILSLCGEIGKMLYGLSVAL